MTRCLALRRSCATVTADTAALVGLLLSSWCVLQWVAPRESPLPLLWLSTAGLGWVALALFPLALLLTSPLWPARWRRRLLDRRLWLLGVPGVVACLVDGVRVMTGPAWQGDASPYRHHWQLFLPATLPSTLLLGGLAAAALAVASRRRDTAHDQPSRRVAEPVRAGGPKRAWRRTLQLGLRLGGALLASGLLVTNLVLYHASLSGPAREPDVVMVLGAKAHADGSPSNALRDRVLTGARHAHRFGHARLLLTGGISRGVSEARVMRRVALQAGLAPARILIDEQGVNTATSFRRLVTSLPGLAQGRLLVVSHGHHLARIRLVCRRLALRCQAVPARQQHRLSAEPWYVFRDALALMVYGLAFR